MTLNPRAAWFASWIALTALTGCESALTGNEGNFQFSYEADDRVNDFNKPLAVGASLDLEVRDVGARQPVTLSAADFAEAGVLEVSTFADQNITITGVGEGTALLEVEGTTANGQTLTDSVNLQSRIPEVLELRHTCSDGAEAAYLTNARAYVPFELEMSNGQPVIGYGYYPLDDVTGVTVNRSDSNQTHIALDAGGTSATVTLSSTIDDTTLDVVLVSEAEIDGITEPIAWVIEDIDVGDTNPFYVLPTAMGRTICQANVTKTVVSSTPEICTIRERDPVPGSGDGTFEFGWFDVTGVAAGTCEYVVTYPGGDGGAGVSATFTFPIEP
ncbi:MAG: hypothetical protein AAGA48_34820 [Myxococcota bacterium]